MANFFLFPIVTFLDASGNPLSGGLISCFAAGTTTPQQAFTDSTGVTPLSNPVVCDSAGRAQIWLAAQSYKFVIQNSSGVAQYTIDGFNSASSIAVTALTDTGNLTLQQSTAATAGANQSGNFVKLQARYWDGALDQTDTWNISVVLGAGANPTTTLQIVHSGTGGTASINLPGSLVTMLALISVAGNPATAGFIRLATGDLVEWRNAANGGNVTLGDAGAAAAGTGNLADNLTWSGGGAQFAAYVDKSAAPAQSGVVRGGNNVTLVAARNAAANADVAAMLVNASNLVALGSGPFLIPAVSDTAVGKATTDTFTNKGFGDKITSYNGIAVADFGHPTIYGTPVHLTGQTANLAATSIYAAPVTGLYLINVQCRTTTAGSGTTATFTLTWADEGGAKSFTSGTFALNSVAIAGVVTTTIPIHVNSGTAVQIAVSGTIGTSVYAVDAWLERIT